MASIGLDIGLSIAQLEAKQDQLEQYEGRSTGEYRYYNFVLKGVKNQDGSVNEDALLAVAEAFDLDLTTESEEAKETLGIGYQGVLSEYDESIDSVVDGMDAAYESMIEQFKNAQIDSEDSQVIANLETSYTEFKTLKEAGKDENLVSDQRKETLEPYAQGIIDDANDFGLSFPLPDRFLERKAEETKNTLDIAFPDREKLKTVDEILEGLKILIAELQETSLAAA